MLAVLDDFRLECIQVSDGTGHIGPTGYPADQGTGTVPVPNPKDPPKLPNPGMLLQGSDLSAADSMGLSTMHSQSFTLLKCSAGGTDKSTLTCSAVKNVPLHRLLRPVLQVNFCIVYPTIVAALHIWRWCTLFHICSLPMTINCGSFVLYRPSPRRCCKLRLQQHSKQSGGRKQIVLVVNSAHCGWVSGCRHCADHRNHCSKCSQSGQEAQGSQPVDQQHPCAQAFRVHHRGTSPYEQALCASCMCWVAMC